MQLLGALTTIKPMNLLLDLDELTPWWYLFPSSL
jgi:hypothetical protein